MDVFSHHSAIIFNDTLKYDSQTLDKTVTKQQTFQSDSLRYWKKWMHQNMQAHP